MQNIMLDMNGKLVRWNSKLAVFTGLSSGELRGRHALDFVVEEDKEITAEAIREAFEKGQTELEMRIIRKDGTAVPHHWTGALLRDGQGNAIGITGIGRDITERKRGEEKLKKKNADLERFNRLAVGRELKMIDLKKEINALLEDQGKEPRYEIAGEGNKKKGGRYEL
jgi:PAS domain S-box-containing protein